MKKVPKFRMTMSLNVLNHLGMNLYSNIPSVLSEVVANAYDADAESVKITIADEEIRIVDNGHGMTPEDVNKKFLHVGYQRRENNEAYSPKFKRAVMGRKGIGKLSLFSIANEIEVHTARLNPKSKKLERSGFLLSKEDIVKQIKTNGSGIYYPKEIESGTVKVTKGTTLIIRKLKKNVTNTEAFLRKRLAKRFSVIGKANRFSVEINNKAITIDDRDFFKKIQMIWYIEKTDLVISSKFKFKRINILPGVVNEKKKYNITGWIGAVNEAGDLETDGVNNNKISVLCRGKMAEEDILESFNEGGIYSKYLIGEIKADFLDDDNSDDIATTSRQKINEEDPRFQELQEHVYILLKQIQTVWTKYRNEIAESEAIQRAEKHNPVLIEWFNSLKTNTRKAHAKKLFAAIETMHFDKSDAELKKRELYKQGILAFEKLQLRDSLHELENITNPDNLKLSNIFNDLGDIEASLYYDIASQRVGVIQEFNKKLQANDKEKLLQTYLFDNLWLLNPSWERATEASEIMEQRVEKEFNTVVRNLTPDEKKGRLDIKYRTAAGKHIILELKRYNPTYKIDQFILGKQAKKYKEALLKCLKTVNKENEAVEILIVLGTPISKSSKEQAEIDESLKIYNARIIYYDTLIDQSLESYSSYLTRQKEVGKLRSIIDRL